MIISRVAAVPDGFGEQIGYLRSRAAAVILPAPGGPLRVIGLYVPSRDASVEKTERKRKWLAACDAALTSATAGTPTIVAGDLNILEPGHTAPLPVLRPVRVRLLPGPDRYTRPDRRVPAFAPARRRVQLGRPDRRRLPI